MRFILIIACHRYRNEKLALRGYVPPERSPKEIPISKQAVLYYTIFMKELIYEAGTLIVVVLFFDFLERTHPGFAVDRKRDLNLNILALCVTAFAGEIWKPLILSACDALRLDVLLSVASLSALPGAVKVLLGLMAADFCLYWVHWAMHRPFLWRTHAFHHSIPEIWWLAGARTSITHLFLFAVPQLLLGYYLLRFTSAEAGAAFSAGVMVNVWIHANIWVDLGRLEWLLITPNFHRIHHGAKGFSRKNLGFILTIWDRMFGTYIDPRVTGKDFPLFAVPPKDNLFRMILGL
jgi:sterol desaturase/sphingolipid hydroxylase (fatty acid hydroxylase superfamily)